MSLRSNSFKGDPKLEACLISDPAHIVPGSSGPHVGKIQRALIKLDSARIEAGELSAMRYGPSTAAAVLAYKTKRNIVNHSYQNKPDNIVGKMTIKAMDDELAALDPPGSGRDLSRGDSGKDVTALQRLLNHHLDGKALRLKPDGIFGPKTEAAVTLFQSLNRAYPVKMPVTDPAFPRDPLQPTGIVDQTTLAILLDLRKLTTYDAKFSPVIGASQPAARPTRGGAPLLLNTAATGAGPAVGDDPPKPPRTLRFVSIQAGEQGSANPWDFSPFVLNASLGLLAKNDGRPDLLLTGGGQIALNRSGSPNGSWTGQGFLQMGLGGFPFAKFGRLDLLNPFVQFMLTHNDIPGSQANTVGFAIGNQINFSLISTFVNGVQVDTLSFFLNGQAVANVFLHNGLCAAPAGQLGAGVNLIFF